MNDERSELQETTAMLRAARDRALEAYKTAIARADRAETVLGDVTREAERAARILLEQRNHARDWASWWQQNWGEMQDDPDLEPVASDGWEVGMPSQVQDKRVAGLLERLAAAERVVEAARLVLERCDPATDCADAFVDSDAYHTAEDALASYDVVLKRVTP